MTRNRDAIGCLLAIGLIVFLVGAGIGYLWPQPHQLLRVGAGQGCPYWVSINQVTTLPHWQLTSCVYQDETQSGGNHNMYFVIVDEHYAPATVMAYQSWPDPVESPVGQLAIGGQTNFGLYGGPFYPDQGQTGPYCGYVESEKTSDKVCGMGLPANRHVNYILTFQKKVSDTSTPTTIPPTIPGPTLTPGPTAIPGDYVTHSEFRQLLIDTLRDILERGR
jgi:hypothetical protein